MFVSKDTDIKKLVDEMQKRDEKLSQGKMYKALFAIEPYAQNEDDGKVKTYVGWTDGRTWNGWATPHFEKEVADQYVADYDHPDWGLHGWYNEDRDQYEFEMQEDDWDVYPSEERDGMTLYPIGAWCWVWDMVARWDEERGEWVGEDQFGRDRDDLEMFV